LDDTIHVTNAHTVVLGLGYATLEADGGKPAMRIADVDDVSVGGILFEAGQQGSPTLLEVGPAGSAKSHASAPTALYDIFCRVGGAGAGQASSCMTINSSDVFGDNFWLWRADHGDGVGWDTNPAKNGIIVNGDRVTMYGLFVEHFQEYQTLWNGEDGRVHFYQSELPYDPPYQGAWQHDGEDGFASFKIADSVSTHHAWGLGVYSVFTNDGVNSENAIETPAADGVEFHHMIIEQLGHGGVRHIINGQGDNKTDY
jgi:hypothetical protein